MSINDHNRRDNLLIFFTRYPIAGKAKTRLIPSLGEEGAAQLQQLMTEYTIKQLRLLPRTIYIEVRYDGGSEEQMKEWLGNDLIYTPQSEGDLGVRMGSAFKDGFNKGYQNIVLIGSDCPDNRVDNILLAFDKLKQSRSVIGPASDGGYYLLGLSKYNEKIFHNIEWGGSKVYKETIKKLNDYQVLPTLNDVDYPEDIPPKISVIIPALNEERVIKGTLRSVKEGFNIEIILSDGGSGDRTKEICREEGVIVLDSPEKGRGKQQNYGATKASGDILLFLHADTILPKDWDLKVREVLANPYYSLGYFEFATKDRFHGKTFIEYCINFRSHFFNRPYGDQALFMRKIDFEKVGSFPDTPILEDVEVVKSLSRVGRAVSTGSKIYTSGRRWQKLGFWRTTLYNQLVFIAVFLRRDKKLIAKAYREGRNPFN